MKRIAIFILLFTFSTSYFSFAEEKAAFKKLITTKCLKCEFGIGASAIWEQGQLKLKKDELNTTIIFDSIDTEKGKARMIANQGSADVMVIATFRSITFIEQTGGGNISFTSIFPNYSKLMLSLQTNYSLSRNCTEHRQLMTLFGLLGCH